MKPWLTITSTKNERIKDLLRLAKPRERRAEGAFAIEGAREIERALHCGFELVRVFYCADVLSEAARGLVLSMQQQALELYEVSRSVFDKIAVREGSDGLIAVCKMKAMAGGIAAEDATGDTALRSLSLSTMPLLLALERVEKPGNLGAILRSADGAGGEAVLLLGQAVDAFNPNVIRSSLGTVFHIPTVACSDTALLNFCKQRGIQILAAALHKHSVPYHQVDWCRPSLILLGNEATGLSPFWLEHADQRIQIPMHGIADSLNVSTAGAVLLYEARRQRSL